MLSDLQILVCTLGISPLQGLCITEMSKLHNVKGRISYITSHARQENLYATYRTADNELWSNLARESKSKGWLPNLFRGIVAKTKDFLQNLIREKDMPPKPTLDIDMAEFHHMRNLMIKVQDKAVKIKETETKIL